MNCFKHETETAVGICKYCAKAVCSECAIDTGKGLACSEKCIEEVNAYDSMMGRARNLYGMGEGGEKIPIWIIMFFMFGAIIMGTGVYRYITYSKIDYISLLMGGTFLVLAVMAYLRNKRIGISN